jgi:hypothetical protein
VTFTMVAETTHIKIRRHVQENNTGLNCGLFYSPQ